MQFNVTLIANLVLFVFHNVPKKGIHLLSVLDSGPNHTPVFLHKQLKYGVITEYYLAAV